MESELKTRELTSALADTLEALGWDGTQSTMGIEVLAHALVHVGRVEITVRPFNGVLIGTDGYNVTPQAFLAALRGEGVSDSIAAAHAEKCKAGVT